ncbi:hypothetical protein BSKO_00397 [Bryopsis sp. KO-2023]|nr:hypothetical protein BSKO_00397 [Bryopsis sp. KO-2023]
MEDCFSVELVSSSGASKPMTLKMNGEGITFLQPDGEVFIHSTYSSLQRWKQSCTRGNHAGEPDCLDVQLNTTRGPQILRIKAPGLAVYDLQSALKKWVQFVAGNRYANQEGSTTPPRTPKAEGPGLSSSLGFGQSMGLMSPMSVTGEPTSEKQPGLDSGGGGGGEPRSKEGVPPGLGGDNSEGKAGTNTSQKVLKTCSDIVTLLTDEEEFQAAIFGENDSKAASSNGGDENEERRDLKGRIRFLEDLVRRLSDALEECQTSSGKVPQSSSTQDVGDVAGLPPAWLAESDKMCPLLGAYDVRIGELNSRVEESAEVLDAAKKQAEILVKENENLRKQLRESMDFMEKNTSGNAGVVGEASEVVNRLTLLAQENELLSERKEGLERQVAALDKRLCEEQQESKKLGLENVQLVSKMKSQAAEIKEYKDKRDDTYILMECSKKQLGGAEGRMGELRTELDNIKQENEMLKHRAGQTDQEKDSEADDVQRLLARMREAQLKLKRAEVEFSNSKEDNAILRAELNASHGEAVRLHEALRITSSSLKEYQTKDSESFIRVKEAVDAAENAKSTRDAAIRKEVELRHEVESLNQKLKVYRQEAHAELQAAHSKHSNRLMVQLEQAEEEARRARHKLSDMEASNQSLIHEKRLLEEQHEELKKDLSGSKVICSLTGITVSGVEEMQRLQQVEYDRQEAVEKLASVERAAERRGREWESEKRHLEANIQELRKKAADLQVSQRDGQLEVTRLQHQLDTSLRQHSACKKAREEMESGKKQEMKRMRLEHEKEVITLTSKMEKLVGINRRQLDEAQAIMDSREALVVRWKEEALVLSNRCERIVAERAEIEEALKNEVAELKEELRTIQRGEGDFGKQISSMQRSQADMRSALEAALQRASIAEAVSEQARIREEEHEQERSELLACIDRAAVKVGKTERERDAFGMRFETIRRQLEQSAQR